MNFIKFEISNPQYFKNNHSKFIKDYEQVYFDVVFFQSQINNNDLFKKFRVKDDLDIICSKVNSNRIYFNQIIAFANQRGCSDKGLFGELANIRNTFDENIEYLNKPTLAFLLDFENDLFQFNPHKTDVDTTIINLLRYEVTNSYLPKNKKTELLQNINQYKDIVQKIINLDKHIGGATEQQGLLGLISKNETDIQELTENINAGIEAKEMMLKSQSRTFYLIFSLAMLFLFILLSNAVSKKISKPIEELSDYISRFILSNYKMVEPPIFKKPTIEINQLLNSFKKLTDDLRQKEQAKIKAQASLIENQVKDRELSDMLPQSIFETNEKNKIIYANNAFLKKFRYTESDIKQGIYLNNLVIIENPEKIFENCKSKIELVALKSNCDTFMAKFYIHRVVSNGKYMGFRGVVFDYTNQKRYISLLRKEKTEQTAVENIEC